MRFCIFLTLLVPLCTAFSGIPSLADDYAVAQQRRALEEEALLERENGPFELPYFTASGTKKKSQKGRPTGGSGFGAKSTSGPKSATASQKQTAADMAEEIRKDGVIRLPGILSQKSCEIAREHVLKIQNDVLGLSQTLTTFDPMAYYGVEPGRTCRTDLLLPLDPIVQSTLCELLSTTSPLRHLFCELFPLDAPLYEVAAVITSKGSHRQTIHPDLPHKPECPLYVVFCALQDVTPNMGPTTFLRGTQNEPMPHDLDETLQNADVVISTLKAGDVVLFDARTLHCGNANNDDIVRAIFNFSFRQPNSGPLGYEGSIRKGYIERLTLGDLLQVADTMNGSNERSLLGELGDGVL